MDAEVIKQAVHAALDERDGMDRGTHRAHHDYINRRIEREERRERRRQELADKIKATVVGGLLLLVLSAWSGLWAVANKMFAGRLQFWRHVRIACTVYLASEALRLVAHLAAFSFSLAL